MVDHAWLGELPTANRESLNEDQCGSARYDSCPVSAVAETRLDLKSSQPLTWWESVLVLSVWEWA